MRMEIFPKLWGENKDNLNHHLAGFFHCSNVSSNLGLLKTTKVASVNLAHTMSSCTADPWDECIFTYMKGQF